MGDASSALLQVFKWICNTLFHQCIAVVASYAIWIPIQNYVNPFSWHVILCTLGVIPFMAEAVILFSNDNVWSQGILRKKKYWIHGILIGVASFLIIAGIAIEIDHKTKKTNPKHFVSAHAITGLIAIIFMVFGLVSGPLAFFSSSLRQIGYIMGIVCLCLGYYTGWFSRRTSENSRIAATIVTVLIAVWSLMCVWKSVYHYIKSIIH